MDAAPTQHEELIGRFRADLEKLEPSEIIRKHITTGTPVAIAEEAYFDLRRIVAKEFDLHPSAVVLIGSCRTGFSISPKKRYRPARPDSDFDVALVSVDRFDDYWDDVFAYARSDSAWKCSKEYKHFVRMLFNGWIDPRGLPNVNRFERAAQWSAFFDELMQSRQFGVRRVSARLYRTWARLEAYQENAVRQCIANLGESHA
jgi:hypothetical protein